MAIEPGHPIWKRTRQDHHGGAVRNYMKDDEDDGYPRGPNASPRTCPDCDAGSGYDSASPESVSWYVSSGDSSEDLEDTIFEKPDQCTFDMKGNYILGMLQGDSYQVYDLLSPVLVSAVCFRASNLQLAKVPWIPFLALHN